MPRSGRCRSGPEKMSPAASIVLSALRMQRRARPLTREEAMLLEDIRRGRIDVNFAGGGEPLEAPRVRLEFLEWNFSLPVR